MAKAHSEHGLHAIIRPAFVAFGSFAVLVSLGAWQLERLTWKEQLIGQIAERSAEPPQSAPDEAAWPSLSSSDYEYRHVRAQGRWLHDKEALVYRASPPDGKQGEGPGYSVLTPLQRADGSTIIVNRGFVPLNLRDPASRAAGQTGGEADVTGLMRSPETRNLFTPADEPDKGLWFTRDTASIARRFGLARVAPFAIDADAAPIAGGWPRGGATALNIPNNHLSYAFTWFGLAATLAGVFSVWAWGRLKAPPRPPSSS